MMTNRDRMGHREAGGDWAEQVPRHDQPRGPYEDYGWARGESVLPEFRDPSVHEMPYDRRQESRRSGSNDWPSSAISAQQRRAMMRNPYDDEMYQRGRFSQTGYRRDYDYDRDQDQNRWRSGRQEYSGGYGRDYDQDRWRSGRSYGRDYNQERWRGGDEYLDRDEERWRSSGQRYSGAYRHDYDQEPRRGPGQGYGGGYAGDYGQDRWGPGSQGYTSFSRGYDQDRWRSDNQAYGGSYGRDYEQERWRTGGQGYGGSSSMPMSWSYTEYWLIPGPFTGRGPRGYQRSDERIKEEVCDRLTQHGRIDASDMDVQVDNCEVTLTGAVQSREAKRMAEDVVDSVQGVREVHNQLRVQQNQQPTQGQPEPQQRAVGGAENRS